jgi:hypothetical protein
MDFAPNEFGLQRPSANGRPAPTEKNAFCVGGGRRLARSAWRGRFQLAWAPLADGRPGAPNEFGLKRPSADGRPAPTEKMPSALAEAGAWRGAPWEANFNRRGRLWPTVGLGCRMNSALRGLRPTVGLRRPKKCLLRWRRPAPGAERLGRPISIGVKRPTPGVRRVPNEFGLKGPSAGGRPAPTRKASFASAEADAWRVSACGGRFQSALGVTQLGPNWVIPTAICGVFWPITRHIWGSLPANFVSPTA